MRTRGSKDAIEPTEGRCHILDYAEGRASKECRARQSGLEYRAVQDAAPGTSEQISGRIVRGGSTVGRSVRRVPRTSFERAPHQSSRWRLRSAGCIADTTCSRTRESRASAAPHRVEGARWAESGAPREVCAPSVTTKSRALRAS